MQRHKKKMHEENLPVTASVDMKPIIQGSGAIQDLSDTGLTLQHIQYIQRAMGENQQAVKILQAGGNEQEMKIIRTGGVDVKDETVQEVKIIPAGIGEQIVSLATGGSTQASQISYIEGGSVQEDVAAGVHEVRYIQQDDGTTQAVVNAPEYAEMGEVQTIMVEVPHGQELDANSIMTLLQQHQQ